MSFSARQTASHSSFGPSVREAPSPAQRVCRCGTVVRTGAPTVYVDGIPSTIVGVFENRTFCSVGCVRAFCLESLEALDALDTAESEKIVTDLHQVYLSLAETFAIILLST